MVKTKLYLWLAIVFFVLAILNLLNLPQNDPLGDILINVGWIIIAGLYLFQYLRKQKKEAS